MSALTERQRRWRLILGGGEADGIDLHLTDEDIRIDRCLSLLYDPDSALGRDKRGGLGKSAPTVARWLGEIREFFPSSLVRVMQQDAITRLGLREMLLQPEVLETVEADVHLVATLISLKSLVPAKAKATARAVVGKVAEELRRKFEGPMRQAVNGSLNRSMRNRAPRLNEMDWHRTIRANLKHYQPRQRTIIPEVRIGFGRRRSSLKNVILCVDQSGSMAASVIYSGIFAAVMASLPALSTQLVVFDTAVVDLSEQLQDDPVDLLFGVQLGGGTDINRALAYCQQLVTRPEETIFILISDLYEGGNQEEMLKRTAAMVQSGMRCISLLALSDDGAPAYNHELAAVYAGLGIPVFACTPDRFADLMAAALSGRDLREWAGNEGIVTARGKDRR